MEVPNIDHLCNPRPNAAPRHNVYPTFNGMYTGPTGPRDYEKIYPDIDKIYHECDDDARVWLVYNDEADIFDQQMIGENGEALDVTLVFAALFSAITTTFVAQTSQLLPRDNASLAVDVLVEVTLLLRAQLDGANASFISVTDTYPIDDSTMTLAWVNGLWFISLVISLSTALFCALAKQWLRQYMSRITGRTPKERAFIHQIRFMRFTRWHVRTIIGILPTLLHTSVIIFLAGLCHYSISVGMGELGTLQSMVFAISGWVITVYACFFLAPILDPSCPYKGVLATDTLGRLVRRFRSTLHRSAPSVDTDYMACADMTAQVLLWVCQNSSNPSAHRIVRQALGACPAISVEDRLSHLSLWNDADGFSGSPNMDQQTYSPSDLLSQAERWIRACTRLDQCPSRVQMNLIEALIGKTGLSDNIRLALLYSTYTPNRRTVLKLGENLDTTPQDIAVFLLEHWKEISLPTMPTFVWEGIYAKWQAPKPTEHISDSFLGFVAQMLSRTKHKTGISSAGSYAGMISAISDPKELHRRARAAHQLASLVDAFRASQTDVKLEEMLQVAEEYRKGNFDKTTAFCRQRLAMSNVNVDNNLTSDEALIFTRQFGRTDPAVEVVPIETFMYSRIKQAGWFEDPRILVMTQTGQTSDPAVPAEPTALTLSQLLDEAGHLPRSPTSISNSLPRTVFSYLSRRKRMHTPEDEQSGRKGKGRALDCDEAAEVGIALENFPPIVRMFEDFDQMSDEAHRKVAGTEETVEGPNEPGPSSVRLRRET